MTWTQRFYVERELSVSMAETPRKAVICHAEFHAPQSYAFFCPVCGDVWAHAAVRHDTTLKEENYTVWEIPCRRHSTDSQRVPGSMWLAWDKDFTDAFPEEVLKWELDRHLDYAERKLQHDKST